VKIAYDAGVQAHLDGSTDALFAGRLGPAIRDDAARRCPKDTGALAESGESHLENHVLIIGFTGNGERNYASYVDGGHRIVGPGGVDTGRRVGPQPFMRSALYQERGDL
jgi:hypothetical protein